VLVRALLSILLVAISASVALAQDPTEVDPSHYTVAFENDDVRVLRIHYGPGETSVMHEHPEGVAIQLTTTTWRMHAPDGTSADYSTEANQVEWADAVVHSPENTTDEAGEVFLVEFKKHDGKKHHDGHDDDYDHEDEDDSEDEDDDY
jgi:quercetin dioxygenase-like cupin family protein